VVVRHILLVPGLLLASVVILVDLVVTAAVAVVMLALAGALAGKAVMLTVATALDQQAVAVLADMLDKADTAQTQRALVQAKRGISLVWLALEEVVVVVPETMVQALAVAVVVALESLVKAPAEQAVEQTLVRQTEAKVVLAVDMVAMVVMVVPPSMALAEQV
jgi:hypothetical protein